jgi:hypothetical protein
MLKRLSSLIPFFIINLIALSASGVKSLIDGAIAVVSSDPGVLEVTALGEGRFNIKIVGPGLATLTVTADVDLSDEVREITQTFDFEIYDASLEANHFDLSIALPDAVIPAAPAPSEAVAEPAPAEAEAEPVPTETVAEAAPAEAEADPAPAEAVAEPAATEEVAQPEVTDTTNPA